MWDRIGVYRVLVGKPEEKRPLEDPGVDVRMILRRLFRKVGWRGGMDWIYLSMEAVGEHL
jgi:hypothetical protein